MRRNCGHHDGLHHTSLEVISFIRSHLRDLSTLDMTAGVLVGSLAEQWHPTIEPLVKENFNAMYKGCDCTSCFGVVVRDCHGQVLGACTQLHRHVFSAFVAKALTFVWFVDFAYDLGLQRVVFNGDSLHVIRKLCLRL